MAMKAQYDMVLNLSKDGICPHFLLRPGPLKVPGTTYSWHMVFEVGAQVLQRSLNSCYIVCES